MAASQSGEIVSFSAIARECHLPVRTIQSYYEILEDTLIGFRLQPYREKAFARRLWRILSFIFLIWGVVNAINKRLTGEMDRQSFGRLFEQWVVLETYRLSEYQARPAFIPGGPTTAPRLI